MKPFDPEKKKHTLENTLNSGVTWSVVSIFALVILLFSLEAIPC